MTAIAYTNSTIAFGDDDLVTTVYTAQVFPKGLYREQDGKGYRFVQYNDGTANINTVAGSLCYVKAFATDPWEVCTDVSDTANNLVRGVATAVMTDGTYGWIQTKGYGLVLTNGDDDITIGMSIIPSAAGDGTCDSVAAGTAPTNRIVGWATASDSDSANTVLVDIQMD